MSCVAWSTPAERRSITTARCWLPPPMGSSRREVAALTDAVGTAEATAAVIWRGETIPYRSLRNRISEISGRAERNGLFASYVEAEEAINPLRRERFERIGAVARDLGYADYVELIRTTRGFDPDALGAEIRDFLAESETPYFAALRRFLARIEIEQGDASLADLWYLMRGSGWDNWFDGRRMLGVLEATLRGMGIELRGQAGATLDVEARPNKSPRAVRGDRQLPARRAPGDPAARRLGRLRRRPARGRAPRALPARRPAPAGLAARARRLERDRGLRHDLRAPARASPPG